MVGGGVSVFTALTRFDIVVKALANHAAPLTDRQKDILDEALSLHADACSKLNLPIGPDHTARLLGAQTAGARAAGAPADASKA